MWRIIRSRWCPFWTSGWDVSRVARAWQLSCSCTHLRECWRGGREQEPAVKRSIARFTNTTGRVRRPAPSIKGWIASTALPDWPPAPCPAAMNPSDRWCRRSCSFSMPRMNREWTQGLSDFLRFAKAKIFRRVLILFHPLLESHKRHSRLVVLLIVD